MASLDMEYVADELPVGNGDFSPLPDGWYSATITKADLKATKTGGGQYIAIRYDITGPTHEGRIVFGNLNIKNASSVAEDIGRQQLGEIMRAVGLAKVVDTDELLGASLLIKLATRKQEGYEPTNDIKAFKSLDGAELPVPTTQKESAPATEKKAAPWAVKK